jgi:multidrug resistance efflux pump
MDEFAAERMLVEQAEADLEEEKRSGADPGHIAEMEHHVRAARRHLDEAERMAKRRDELFPEGGAVG